MLGLKYTKMGKRSELRYMTEAVELHRQTFPIFGKDILPVVSARRSENGTGLGLSIVKEILTAHMAQYGVISREGHGSCFWFELPFSQ